MVELRKRFEIITDLENYGKLKKILSMHPPIKFYPVFQNEQTEVNSIISQITVVCITKEGEYERLLNELIDSEDKYTVIA